MKKIFIVLISLVLAAGIAGFSFAGIQGSRHDFSAFGFAGGQICVPCHTPHFADPTVDQTPLWNHEVTVANFNLYTSPTLTAVVGQPTGSSKLCLSCHDGTVAVDSFGGNFGNIFVDGFGQGLNLETNLADDHPVSFTYDTDLATADPGLFDPEATVIEIGSGQFTKQGTISEVMLEGGTELQCSACHSVHNDFVVNDVPSENKLLKISIGASELCLACHDK